MKITFHNGYEVTEIEVKCNRMTADAYCVAFFVDGDDDAVFIVQKDRFICASNPKGDSIS